MSDRELPISVIELGVGQYPGKSMYNWRLYRIEYGGTHQNCIWEDTIWVPPCVSAEDIRNMFSEWQKRKRE